MKKNPEEKTMELKLVEEVHRLTNRVLQLERVIRVLGWDWLQQHATEEAHRKAARRAHSMSNSMREVRDHLKRYGNEFDKEPHMPDPHRDYDQL